MSDDMETKRVFLIGGSNSGSTGKVYDTFWKSKDGSAWKPDSHANTEELEEDDSWQKYYLMIFEDSQFMGPPKPRIISSESVKVIKE